MPFGETGSQTTIFIAKWRTSLGDAPGKVKQRISANSAGSATGPGHGPQSVAQASLPLGPQNRTHVMTSLPHQITRLEAGRYGSQGWLPLRWQRPGRVAQRLERRSSQPAAGGGRWWPWEFLLIRVPGGCGLGQAALRFKVRSFGPHAPDIAIRTTDSSGPV
jgi:hypothetical protein